MSFKKNNLAVFSLMILLCFGSLDDAARAQSGNNFKLDPARIFWTDLSFRAKNFWVEVSTDVQLRSLSASKLANVLPVSPRGNPIKPLATEAAEMTIHTTIEPKFRSAVSIDNRIWFDPTNGSALGRIRLRRGEDDFKKIYRFTRQGVFRHRIEPKNKKEASLEPENWTDIKDFFYPYELAAQKCTSVTEPSLLIYIISTAAIAQLDNQLWLCAFGKRQLHGVQLRPQGFERLEVSYLEKKSNRSRQQKRQIQALKIALTSNPMESVLNDAENFSFFGFHTDIALYIDPTYGLPLRVSGSIPAFGKAHLELREVNLRMHTD